MSGTRINKKQYLRYAKTYLYATRLSKDECIEKIMAGKMDNYPVRQQNVEEAYLALDHGVGLGITNISKTDQFAIMERIHNYADKDKETSSD